MRAKWQIDGGFMADFWGGKEGRKEYPNAEGRVGQGEKRTMSEKGYRLGESLSEKRVAAWPPSPSVRGRELAQAI